MMNKIGIATVFTGYNYGSALQAFATKYIVDSLGYKGVLLSQKGSLIKGRDARFGKFARIGLRALINWNLLKRGLSVYNQSTRLAISEKSKEYFAKFTKEYLIPEYHTWKELKKLSKENDYKSFLCGSDQIWNAESLYVDPFYYLQFAPVKKRVAFAPSFGRDFIPNYNQTKISKYISSIRFLSAREESGVKLIENMTGRNASWILDPTIIVSANQWNQALSLEQPNDKEGYLLAYFLNTPSDKAQQIIQKISKQLNIKVITVPYEREKENWFSELVNAGPREFVDLVRNASFICTDSFHGTAFAVNYEIPFYTFERQYQKAGNQSTRILSLLKLTSLMNRYDPEIDGINLKCDFKMADEVLLNEREKAINYLIESIHETDDIEGFEKIKEVVENKSVESAMGTVHCCTGCGMCSAVCPVSCINIELDENGFYTPNVDLEKCVNCGKCRRVCYRFDKKFVVKACFPLACYSAKNKDKFLLKESSSGGVSYELMKQCIQDGFKVVGVAYDYDKNRAVTKIAENINDLPQFAGSKYFQSYTKDAYEVIVKDKSPQKYAIFGTPCQIYAFANMCELYKNRNRFLLVDIFCHGCPSGLLWKKYIADVMKKNGVERFDDIKFRSKTYGWHEFSFDFVANGQKRSSCKVNDAFYELFFGMQIMNKACYDCVSRSSVEKSDIRIGDFWGWQYDQDAEGVSSVVAMTEEGKRLFDKVHEKFEIREHSFEEVIKAQSYGKKHAYSDAVRENLLRLLKSSKPLKSIILKSRKMMGLKYNIRRIAKNCLKKLPQNIYLKIKKNRNRLS